MENKCKKGYKLDDGKCVKKKGIFRNISNFKDKSNWWIYGIIAVILIVIILVVVFNFDGIKNIFSISSDVIPSPTSGGGSG